MSGYCATGSVQTAMPPARTMRIDRTEAKMGRSMKKRENMRLASSLLTGGLASTVMTRRGGETSQGSWNARRGGPHHSGVGAGKPLAAFSLRLQKLHTPSKRMKNVAQYRPLVQHPIRIPMESTGSSDS